MVGQLSFESKLVLKNQNNYAEMSIEHATSQTKNQYIIVTNNQFAKNRVGSHLVTISFPTEQYECPREILFWHHSIFYIPVCCKFAPVEE